MMWLKSALKSDPDSQELLQAISRNLIFTTLAIYTAWHFTATLAWPRIFSPSLWVITALFFAASLLCVRLVQNYYVLAQVIWFSGLVALILYAYSLYHSPEITLLLVFLPLMSVVTIGHMGTLAVDFFLLAIILLLPHWPVLPALPPGYNTGLILGSAFTSAFGWGLSNHLLSAIAASSYHYRQARKLLQESRENQAQISLILKDQHQTNYQLERLNQMLHHARQRAEEARDSRDRFILAVSHELRSPLNFILGFSDLMVNSPETYADLDQWPPGLYDDVQEIYRSSTHLLSLINDILDMGQIDANQMTIFRERVKLEQIVQEVVSMVSPAFEKKGLWLRTEIEGELPHVFVDCTRIRQALLNLVNNGLRFTQHGGVTIALKRQPGDIQVQVSDTGSGIAEGDLAKVFDEFRQVGQDSWRRREGTGLGLSISRRFVQLHGGKMWLESELGQGTRFYFTIPFEELPELDLTSTAEQERADQRLVFNHQVRQEKLVVLLSKDGHASRLVKQELGDFKVLNVSEWEDLRKAVQTFFPRALLVDRDLAQEVQPALATLPYQLPVIQIAMPTVRQSSKDLPSGVVNYLVKPISRKLLVETVESLGDGIRSILVVDDDPAMVRFVTQALKSPEVQSRLAKDYRFYTAFNGEEALQHLQANKIDAILLDLDLPDINGWEVLAQVRREARFAGTPVVIVSAVDMPKVLYSGGQTILDLWTNRPFFQQEFSALLRSVLEQLQPGYAKLN